MQRRGTVWSTSPALLLAVALATGIWWSDGHTESAVGHGLITAGVALSLVVLMAASRRPTSAVLRPLWRTVLALLVVAGAGFFRNTRAGEGQEAWSRAYEAAGGRTVQLAGRVAQRRRAASGKERFVLNAVRLKNGDRIPGHVLVYPSALNPVPRTGDRVEVSGRLAALPEARNPGEFDYGVYLRRRAIHARVFVGETERLNVIRPARGLLNLTDGVRTHVETVLATHISSDASRSILIAMVLGDRSGIDRATHDNFIATGLVHLLAVSGLHVMIIGLMFYRLSGPALLRAGLRWERTEVVRALGTLSLLVVYALLTGLPASVVRAVTMTAALLLGPIARRRPHSLNSLGVASTAILWAQPYSLFDPGFQLSVSAVAGIILMAPPLKEKVAQLHSAKLAEGTVCTSLIVSLSATASTLPVLMAHFGRASLAGIPLNVVAIPLTAAALSSTVLCLGTAPIPLLAFAFGACADVCMRMLMTIASVGAQALSPVVLTTPPGPIGYVVIVTVILMLQWLTRPARIRVTLAAGIILIGLLRLRPLVEEPALDVLFFDVGQGDATLIRTPSGATMLVDAGPRNDRFDAGTRIILPFLLRQRVPRIDILLLTHAHADHIGGAASILRSFDVGRLVYAGSDHPSSMMHDVVRIADSAQVPRQPVAAGDTLQIDVNLRLHVLGPSPPVLAYADENDRSVVMMLAFGETSVLLMGDAEELAESVLVDSYRATLEADAVKVGHHGSNTSSRPRFVSAVTTGSAKGSLAVVSVARNNSYRLPSRAVIKRWENAGLTTVSTASAGAVHITSDGTRFERIDWRRRP